MVSEPDPIPDRIPIPNALKISGVSVLLGALATLGILFLAGFLGTRAAPRAAESPGTAVPSAARHTMIHERGGMVMPFDLDATTHVFEMTTTGGVEDVVVKEGADTSQLALVRRHLRHEATAFARGDFSDPAALHGSSMPGLAELAAAGDRLDVGYTELPRGARITFVSSDVAVVTAVHRWFGAQLADHGADASTR